ncbi:hypothetical protein ACOMHN_014544 [Nucella lapillus]
MGRPTLLLLCTVLLTVPNQTSLKLIRFNSPEPPPFIDLQNGTLYLNDTFLMDDQQHTININVNLTDDFPPEFTTNFSAEIQEAGNRNDAFEFPNPRRGRIVVRRMLDFESGDDNFILNISVSDNTLPDRKSYTTLEVNVLDIDDNDPVFDQSHYVLHVQEQDASSVGVWVSTEPPISVSDPDKRVAQQDPLTVLLYNASDANIMEVNSSTGQVKLKTTFDREQQSSHPVILKVQQNISWWRSSTATVTILVDDVNDNPPLFSRPTYDVTVAEHSPHGTSVVMVLATDADVGENAIFTYTLVGGADAFSLVERRFGEHVYGLVLVHNSSLLDREISSQMNLTIGTEERDGGGGGGGGGGGSSSSPGCQGNRCQTLVTLTLQDINDNDPVFRQQRYVFRVNTSRQASVIATVTAEDADLASNADVRYSISEVGPGRCDDVTIDDRSGDVSLPENVTLLEECSMIVTACDTPVDLSQRRCSTVPVQILPANHEDGVVFLEVPVPPTSLLHDVSGIEQELDNILKADVRIRRIAPAAVPNRSSVSISATNITSQTGIPPGKLQRLVDDERDAIAAIFQRYQVVTSSSDNDVKKKDGVFSPLFITLVVIIAILLVAVIIAVILIVKSRRRNQKQQRLIQDFSSPLHLGYNNNSAHTHHNNVNTSSSNSSTNTTNTTTTNTNNTAITTIANNNNSHARNDDDDRESGLTIITPANSEDQRRYSSTAMKAEATIVFGGEEHTVTGGNLGHHEGEMTTDREEEVRRWDSNPETDSGLHSDREMVGMDESCQEMTPVMMRRERSPTAGESSTSPYLDDDDELGTFAGMYGAGSSASSSTVDTVRSHEAVPKKSPQHTNPNITSQLPDNSANENTSIANLIHPHPQLNQLNPGDTSPTNSHHVYPEIFNLGQYIPPLRPGAPLEPSPWKYRSTPENEEPEPDYAKKVRFSANVVGVGKGGGGGGGSGFSEDVKEGDRVVGEEGRGRGDGLAEEHGEGRGSETGSDGSIRPVGDSSASGKVNEGEGVDSRSLFWNVLEEMTAM